MIHFWKQVFECLEFWGKGVRFFDILYLVVNIPVPHIIDCASSASHHKGASSKGGEEGEVGKVARACSHADARASEK